MSLKILLDTSYILPSLGIEVDVDNAVFEKLRDLLKKEKAECYYSPFSVLEALWKVAKTPCEIETLRNGLESIERWLRLALPSAEDYTNALELRKKGFADLIDLLLYSTARSKKLRFLTRDKKLVSFLESVEEDVKTIMDEKELLEVESA